MIVIPVVYPDAMQFWMNPQQLNITTLLSSQNSRLISLPENFRLAAPSLVPDRILEKYNLNLPIHCMVNTHSDRRNNKYISSVVKPKNGLPKSFYYLEKWTAEGETVYLLMACPELCFLQAASQLPFLQTVQLGYALCAGYVYDEKEELQQKGRNPVSTEERIRKYLQAVPFAKGMQNARKASSFICNSSNSPMETNCSMLATLPFSAGGFSVKLPEMNLQVLLSNKGAAIMKRTSCSCDLCWKKERVVLEYDSNLTHLSADQHEWDLRKTRALESSGYKVFRITADNMQNVSDAEIIFSQLRKALGQRPEYQRIQRTHGKRVQLMHFLRNNQIEGELG